MLIHRVDLPEFSGVMHLISDEFSAYYSVIFNRFYEEILEFEIRPDWVVLDIGAHVGFFAVGAGRRLRRDAGGRLYAFEPNPLVLGLLNRNIALFGLHDLVTVVPRALFSHAGEATLVLSKNTLAAHMKDFGSVGASRRSKSGPLVSIETTTLDRFVEQEGLARIDLMKINVEGAEFAVFKGAAQKALPIVRRLVISYEAAAPAETLLDYLADFGFRLVKHMDDRYYFVRTSTPQMLRT